ncbi:unnamed protein product [Aspergillus oryzae]|nr:unnamed protein product [Aspergillus oryzae]
MVTDNQPSPPQSRLTTILVNNLHCPSCVTNVEETLSALTPSPFSISTSILSHEIKVVHPITLSSSRIVRALEEVAFEIDSVIAHDSDESDIEAQQPRTHHPASGKHDVHSQSKIHIQKCNECATQLASSSSNSRDDEGAMKEITATAASVSSVENSLTSVMDDRLTGSRTRITLSISGMSCSSCVGKITGALQNRPWILSADVNLLTSSAVIMLMDNSHIDEVLEIIRSSGYAVELIDTEELQPQKTSKASGMADAWRASYVIGGMTCSSCVGKVTDTLNHLDWITKVDVNLVSGSATVEF